jgi:transcriptional regulator with XRE-family HTH domain
VLEVEPERWTRAQAVAWRAWLRQAAQRAGYLAPAAPALGGGPGVFYDQLAAESGISEHWWRAYLTAGVQPSYRRIARVARTLGLHPLAVAQRAGLLTVAEVAPLLATDRLPSPSELGAALTHLRAARAAYYDHAGVSEGFAPLWLHEIETLLTQMQEYVIWLAESFDLRPHDFGTGAANALRAALTLPSPASLPAPSASGRFPQPARLNLAEASPELAIWIDEPPLPVAAHRVTAAATHASASTLPTLPLATLAPLFDVDPDDVGEDDTGDGADEYGEDDDTDDADDADDAGGAAEPAQETQETQETEGAQPHVSVDA